MSVTLALIWLLQNFLQVFVMGIFLVPDIFLLSALLMILLNSSNRDKQVRLVWIAFIGGMLWDLRWTNLPGLTAAMNGLITAIVSYLWYKAPAQGRTLPLFAILISGAQIFSGVIHYFFWDISSHAALRQFMVQQLLCVPVIAILCFIFWKEFDWHV